MEGLGDGGSDPLSCSSPHLGYQPVVDAPQACSLSAYPPSHEDAMGMCVYVCLCVCVCIYVCIYMYIPICALENTCVVMENAYRHMHTVLIQWYPHAHMHTCTHHMNMAVPVGCQRRAHQVPEQRLGGLPLL